MYFYYLPEACAAVPAGGDISDKVACNFRRTLTFRRKKSHRITPQLSSTREHLYACVKSGSCRTRDVFICEVSSCCLLRIINNLYIKFPTCTRCEETKIKFKKNIISMILKN